MIQETSIKFLTPQNQTILSLIAIVAIFFYLSYDFIINYIKKQNSNNNSNNNGKITDLSLKKSYTPIDVKIADNKNRKIGTWKAEKFTYPKVNIFENWSIKDTLPLPYRAFKHTYFFTMGIRSMDWTSWIELDNEWEFYHNEKIKRISERGHELIGTQDDVWDAAIEYLMELRAFLPKRYPNLFIETENGIENLKTGEIFEFHNIPKNEFKKDPMEMAALMVQDDLAILKENENGQYILRGGAIMLAGFWRLRDKLNLPLAAIHTTGEVPKYEEKLQKPMDKFFTRLTVDKPVVRNNYFIQTDDNLAWSSSIGNEDSQIVGWNTAEPATDINKIYYRSERQSVRRLPLTGCIAFTIRTYFLPITKMCQEPHIPKRLLDGILSWDEDVKRYRGFDKFKDVLLPYLEEQVKTQEEKGITVENEKDMYPF
ncbi:hypothetical protein C6P40_001154 [Pichia californica]|uniref:Mannosyltransferase n=1 Tax=Pichia californica TaxID=460514 RepID=A0A9P6WJG8_9ASCO|nr:hypothetical protein C6P42_004129 [[Candida] californica]KAG0688314.1 hypothetical protein C6P40_001154 [[Candida] californica]